MKGLPGSAVVVAACMMLASCGGGMTSPYGAGGGGVGGGGGGGYGGGAGGGTSNSITVGNNFFDPSTTTVAVGTQVTWTWAAGDVAHSVTFDNGGPASPTQSSGSFSYTFTTAGVYHYHCVIHGQSMSGTVTVQ